MEGPRWEPTNPYWNCPAMSKFHGFQRLGNHQQEKSYVFFLVQWWSWTNADLFGNMFGKGLDFYCLLFKFWMNSRLAKGCWVATFLSTKKNHNFFAQRKAAWPCTKVPELPFPKDLEAKLKRCFQFKIKSWGSRKWFKTYGTLPEKPNFFWSPAKKGRFASYDFPSTRHDFQLGAVKNSMTWKGMDDLYFGENFFGWKNPGLGGKIRESSKQ